MKWITATHLQEWGKRLDARHLLIDMVADLIRASNDNLSHFRFPGGDKGQIRGFDGDLEADQQTTYVPGGKSKWEFGITPGSAKAKSDFEKRNDQTTIDDKRLNNLVLVNLNTWDDPKTKLPDWLAEIKNRSDWIDIRYIDGAQLQHWLDMHPAVAAKYAKEILRIMPNVGIQSIEEYWTSYSNKFKPSLKEEVLLCDRQSQVKELLQALMGEPQSYELGAEAPEDVVAFAVAAILTADPKVRLFLESRTLIVETAEAARELSHQKEMVFLLKGGAVSEAGLLSRIGPTLTPMIGPQGRKAGVKLLRPSASEMGKALTTMGFQEEEAYQMALECGRSMTVLQRRLANGQSIEPEWSGLGEVLLPAMLAGGWSIRTSLDKDVLKILSSSSSYEEFERKLRPTLVMKDPPIDQCDDAWVMRSQVDAFPYFQHLIGKSELDLLRETAIKVLGTESVKPDPRAPYNANPPENYSSWLKDGLANTLLQLVTIAKDGGFLVPNSTPQQYVNDIIEALPGWAKTHRTFKILADQLLTLAEAAPDSFLNALESLLEGDPMEVTGLFTDRDTSLFAPTSTHTYVLWALEMLAWDSRLLNRAALVLLKLSSLDPGGSTSNRPLNSLRSLLLPWSPNTYAGLKERVACLDLLLNTDRTEGWKLLVELLPKSHDTTSPTNSPRMRDVKPRVEEVLTYADVWESQSHIIAKCLDLAEENEDRIQIVIDHLSHFSPDDQAKALNSIEHYLQSHVSFEGSKIWFSLRDEVHRHEYFHNTDWALKPEALIQYKAILEKYAPQDPLAAISWLFDDWSPHIGVYEEYENIDVEKTRAEAVIKVNSELGVPGILRLINKVKLPRMVMYGIEAAKMDQAFYEALFHGLIGKVPLDLGLISALSSSAYNLFGNSWKTFFLHQSISKGLAEETVVALLCNWPNNQTTWDIIKTLGESIDTNYWLCLSSLPRDGTSEEFNYAAERFLTIGMPLKAISTFFDRLALVESKLLLRILQGAVNEINQHPERLTNMFSYNLEKILVHMKNQTDISMEDIARTEYAFIKFLHGEVKDLVIHDLMAQQPEFYTELMSNVFRSDNDERTVISEVDRMRASSSYELLSSFTKFPGQDGLDIDLDTLFNWIIKVRELGTEKGREDITDQYIGHLLAHSPMDPTDGSWPHKTIRKVIESFRSIQIERGVATERFNMRGVYRKDLNEGGDQERAIAAGYRNWALAIPECPHTAALLFKMEEEWLHNAELADLDAEKRKLKR